MTITTKDAAKLSATLQNIERQAVALNRSTPVVQWQPMTSARIVFFPQDVAAMLKDAELAHHDFVDGIAADYDKRIADRKKTADSYGKSPKLSGPNVAELYGEKEDAVNRENARWADWYAEYLSARLSAYARAAFWRPNPVPPYPGYESDVAPFDGAGIRCTNCGTSAATARMLDIDSCCDVAPFDEEEATDRESRKDGNGNNDGVR